MKYRRYKNRRKDCNEGILDFIMNTKNPYAFKMKDIIIKIECSENGVKAEDALTKIIALIIYYARQGWPKEEIIKKLSIKIQYKPFQKFNTTCRETIGNCLYALFISSSFEESIKRVISFGGDTDTNACIVGSMAEHMYGISPKLIEEIKNKIPREFTDIIEKGYITPKIADVER